MSAQKRADHSKNKDDVITFEQLGIDKLFIDEADVFKEELEATITDCLNKAEHVETIINTIIHRAKTNRNFNIDELIEMQTELERIRLNLEYKENAKVS